MEAKKKYILWATAEQGEGKVMHLGVFDDPTDIEINTSILGPDVLLTIEQV